MRVNIYAEEMTDRVEIISKTINGQTFTGLRFYLYLPVTVPMSQEVSNEVRGPFLHGENDDDSSAVTFWGKQDLRELLRKALYLLDKHYTPPEQQNMGVCDPARDALKDLHGGGDF